MDNSDNQGHSVPTRLPTSQRRELKRLAHHLSPMLTIGASGLTAGVIDQVRQRLTTEPCAKIRINGDRVQIARLGAELAEQTPCELVDTIGGIVIVARLPIAERSSPPNEPGL